MFCTIFVQKITYSEMISAILYHTRTCLFAETSHYCCQL